MIFLIMALAKIMWRRCPGVGVGPRQLCYIILRWRERFTFIHESLESPCSTGRRYLVQYKIMEESNAPACVPKKKRRKKKGKWTSRPGSLCIFVWVCTSDMWSSNICDLIVGTSNSTWNLLLFLSRIMNITLLNSFRGTKYRACIILLWFQDVLFTGKRSSCVV